jgi:hypothetical protein
MFMMYIKRRSTMSEQSTIKYALMSEVGRKLPLEIRIKPYCVDIKRLVEEEHWTITMIIDVLVSTNIISKRCQIRDLANVINCESFAGVQQPLPIIYDVCEFLAPDPALFTNVSGDSHGN